MKNRMIFFFIIIFHLPLYLFPQDIKFPEMKGFKIHKNYSVFLPNNLWDYIDGAADSYLSLGFVNLHIAEYKKGKEVIKLEIYKHSDLTMAFGIYASERSPSFHFMKLGAQGYSVDGAINFFKGNYYIKIRTYSKEKEIISAVETLAFKIAEMIEGESALPGLLSVFPSDGKKLNEETFINENVLGHKFLKKAFKASYGKGPDSFSIFLLQSLSEDESRKIVKTYLTSPGISFDKEGDERYVLNDGNNGTIYLSQLNNLVVLIEGLSKDQEVIAEKYFSEILK